MRVLVTGANGFLGSWLVKKLISMGIDVSILARPNSDLSLLEGTKFKTFQGDVTSLESLYPACDGHEFVFHLAGVVAYKKSQRLQMEKVNVQGTRNVLQACQKGKVKRLIHTSSVVAIGAGFRPQDVLNESAKFNLTKYNLGYFETKRKAEELVREACQAGYIDAVCVNPSTIYGPGDAMKGSRGMQMKVARGKMPFFTSGGVSIVDVEDVVQGIVKAWQNGRSGERYILSGENITVQQLFQTIAKAAGVRPPVIKMPKALLYGLGHLGDFLSQFGVSGGLSIENAVTATLYHWYDCKKAQTELGFQFRPAEESIRKSIEWAKAKKII